MDLQIRKLMLTQVILKAFDEIETDKGDISSYGDTFYIDISDEVYSLENYNEDTNVLFLADEGKIDRTIIISDNDEYKFDPKKAVEFNVITGTYNDMIYCSSMNYQLTDEDLKAYNEIPKCPECHNLDIKVIPKTLKNRIKQMRNKTKFEYKCSCCGCEW